LQTDYFLFHLINQVWTNPWLDQFFPWMTDLHKTLLFQCTVVPFVGLVFFWKYKKKGLLLFVVTLLCLGFSDFFGSAVIKNNIQRPRPGDMTELHAVVRSPYGGYSFISNHSTNSFAFAIFVSSFFLMSRWPLVFIASLIGYSRIYNGVHFPTDVLCGALLGILWGYLFSIAAKRLLKIHSQSQSEIV